MDFLVAGLRFLVLALLYGFLFLSLRLMFRELGGRQAAFLRKPLAGRQVVAPEGVLPEARLVVEEISPGLGVVKGDSYLLGESTRVGRAEDNEIALQEPHLSQQHARIYYRTPHYYLEDLGSTNGTLLNGKAVREPARLFHGDRIGLGAVEFRFVRWSDAS